MCGGESCDPFRGSVPVLYYMGIAVLHDFGSLVLPRVSTGNQVQKNATFLVHFAKLRVLFDVLADDDDDVFTLSVLR